MKLYYAPASSYSQRVLIALYEKGIPFIPIETDIFNSKSYKAYTLIHPFSKIPAIEMDDGQIFFEACIIIEYLDLYYPQSFQLIPRNTEKALKVRLVERIIDVYINAARQILFLNSQKPVEERDWVEMKKARKVLDIACTQLEKFLDSHCWAAGDAFSMADCAAAPTLTYLKMVYNYQHFSRLWHYVDRLESRDSVAEVRELGRKQFKQMLLSLKYPLEFMPLQT